MLAERNAKSRDSGTQPRKFKVYEKSGTLRVSLQGVKSIEGAMAAMEGVVSADAPASAS